MCFVLLPKNASSTFKHLAVEQGWCYSNYHDIDHLVDRYIVILRDPASRLISATNMFLTGPRMANQTVLLASDFHTEDCHYEKQHKFVQGLNHSKVDFYYHTEFVIHDINSDHDLGFEQIPYIKRTNKLINSVDTKLVKRIYKEDYALIESVQFKNHKL